MITSTALQHPETQRKVFVAMRKAKNEAVKKNAVGLATVSRRDGSPWLCVIYSRRSGFGFYSGKENITTTVIPSLLGFTVEKKTSPLPSSHHYANTQQHKGPTT